MLSLNMLFIKLHAYDICDVFLRWIKNLFSGRTFCTMISVIV